MGKEGFLIYDDVFYHTGPGLYISQKTRYSEHVRRTKLHNAGQKRTDRNEAIHEQRKLARKRNRKEFYGKK